jgi:hypothetical protein
MLYLKRKAAVAAYFLTITFLSVRSDPSIHLPFSEKMSGTQGERVILNSDIMDSAHPECSSKLLAEKNVSKDQSATETKQKNKSFEYYWKTYYPSAKVMTKKFLSMKADKIDEAIQKIANKFSDEPWMYFQNNKKNFDVRFLDSIISEMTIIEQFVALARLNLKDDSIHIFYYGETMPRGKEYNFISLKDYWDEHGKAAYKDLCALHFDYIVIKLNTHILSPFRDKKDWPKIESLLYLMERLVEKLSGSKHEEVYQTYFKRFKKVFQLWQKEVQEREEDNKQGGKKR